ncbi:MAG: hypothetical protein IJQ70_03410, partial [Synergistaceae bacterium]|nr:hypothetical protein [Synergistaceae bacterium]
MSGLKFFTALEEVMRNYAVLCANLSDEEAMFTRKLLSSALLLSIFTTAASAEVSDALPKLNATEAQFEVATVNYCSLNLLIMSLRFDIASLQPLTFSALFKVSLT